MDIPYVISGAHWLGLSLLWMALGASPVAHAKDPASSAPKAKDATAMTRQAESANAWMTVGGRSYAITLADTAAARAFATLLPLALDMEDLNSNEKKKELPDALPTETIRPGMIRTGDLLLWGSNTVVVFYQTFDSPYAYTRLGRINDPADLAQLLGRSNVRVVFSKDRPAFKN